MAGAAKKEDKTSNTNDCLHDLSNKIGDASTWLVLPYSITGHPLEMAGVARLKLNDSRWLVLPSSKENEVLALND